MRKLGLTNPELADDNVMDDSFDLAPRVMVPALGKFKMSDACTIG
jgi:hypothetical protein